MQKICIIIILLALTACSSKNLNGGINIPGSYRILYPMYNRNNGEAEIMLGRIQNNIFHSDKYIDITKAVRDIQISTDEKWLAYLDYPNNENNNPNNNLYIYNILQKKEIPIDNNSKYIYRIIWSPDNKYLAYETTTDEEGYITIIPIDECNEISCKRQIIKSPGYYFANYDWSSDSKSLALMREKLVNENYKPVDFCVTSIDPIELKCPELGANIWLSRWANDHENIILLMDKGYDGEQLLLFDAINYLATGSTTVYPINTINGYYSDPTVLPDNKDMLYFYYSNLIGFEEQTGIYIHHLDILNYSSWKDQGNILVQTNGDKNIKYNLSTDGQLLAYEVLEKGIGWFICISAINKMDVNQCSIKYMGELPTWLNE